MRILLDTHTFLWFLNGDIHLSEKAKELIINNHTEKYISVASLWEIFIKVNIGKLNLDFPPSTLKKEIQKNGFIILPIELEHLEQLLHLDFHHRDPFDRLIIAQAKSEKMTIITKDENFGKYEAKILW